MDRGNNILAFTFIFCVDFIAIFAIFSLQFFVLISLQLFSDQSSNAIFGRCLYRGCCYFNMYKSNQLTGNVYNDSKVTINEWKKISDLAMLCKVCFLARKDKQRDREPSPFGPFYWPKWRIFPSFHISEHSFFWSLKKVPLSRGASPYRSLFGVPSGIKSAIRSPFLALYMTSGMNTLILCIR